MLLCQISFIECFYVRLIILAGFTSYILCQIVIFNTLAINFMFKLVDILSSYKFVFCWLSSVESVSVFSHDF